MGVISPMLARPPASRTSGFTLIELLAVIAIIAIIAGIVIGGIPAVRKRASAARCRAELTVLTNALENYKRHYGDYPQLGEFAHATITPTNNAAPGVNMAEAKLFNCLT